MPVIIRSIIIVLETAESVEKSVILINAGNDGPMLLSEQADNRNDLSNPFPARESNIVPARNTIIYITKKVRTAVSMEG